MKDFVLRASLCCGLFFLLLAGEASASQWKYDEGKDALTGKVTSNYLFTYSVVPFKTTLGLDTYLVLGLTCGGRSPYLRSDEISLDADVSCDEWGCSSYQRVRLMFDENEPVSLKGRVWEKRNGITLETDKGKDIIGMMKQGSTLLFEFTPLLGYEKGIALFSLIGFSDALSKCPPPEPEPELEPVKPAIPQESVTKGTGDYQLKGGIYGD